MAVQLQDRGDPLRMLGAATPKGAVHVKDLEVFWRATTTWKKIMTCGSTAAEI